MYEAVPIFLLLWGSVLACYVKLLPQIYIYISFIVAVIFSVIIAFYYRSRKPLGHLSISANQAWLITDQGRFFIEFKHFSGWRLFGVLTVDPDKDLLASEVNIFARFIRLFCFTHNTVLSIYHTKVSKENYNYLRSFAAYQCFVKQKSND